MKNIESFLGECNITVHTVSGLRSASCYSTHTPMQREREREREREKEREGVIQRMRKRVCMCRRYVMYEKERRERYIMQC